MLKKLGKMFIKFFSALVAAMVVMSMCIEVGYIDINFVEEHSSVVLMTLFVCMIMNAVQELTDGVFEIQNSIKNSEKVIEQ